MELFLITVFPTHKWTMLVICIPVKLHQVYFLIFSLEIVDCRCLYHIYYIDNRSSKQFKFVLFKFKFKMQTWTELEFFAARSMTYFQKVLSTFSVVYLTAARSYHLNKNSQEIEEI